jgi:hypothetical protein
MSSSFRRANVSTNNNNNNVLISKPQRNHDNQNNNNDAFSPITSYSTKPSSIVLERKGTKPWIGGLTLTSCGLRELDAIMGGGQPLGTVVLLEEDRWTQDLALSIARYWCAEGISQSQRLALIATRRNIDPTISLHYNINMNVNANQQSLQHSQTNILNMQQGLCPHDLTSFLDILPRNLHLDKANATKPKTVSIDKHSNTAITSTQQPSPSIQEQTIIEAEDEDFEDGEVTQDHPQHLNQNHDTLDTVPHDADDADAGLINAWQYKLSVQNQRSGFKSAKANTISSSSATTSSDRIFCHSYDLSGKLKDQYPEDHLLDTADNPNSSISILDCSCTLCQPITSNQGCIESTTCAFQLYHKCTQYIQTQLAKYPDTVLRIALLNAPIRRFAIALPLLLTYIRSNSLPVVLLTTIRPWLSTHTPTLISLRRSCDAILSFEGFQALISPPPPEFSDLAGILSIRKMSLVHGGSCNTNALSSTISSTMANTTTTRPPSNRYGMKRDRRKLHIRLLHLPPEDFSAGGSSVDGSGVRSGAGRVVTKKVTAGLGCASNLQGGGGGDGQHNHSISTSLDF